MESDEQLAAACLFGNDKAFAELLERYLKPIYGFLYQMVRDQAVVEDLAQETFIKAWKNMHRFDQSKSFKTWIFTIAKNTALDYLKKKKTTPFSFFEDEKGNSHLENVSEDAALPDEILEREDVAREMEDKLELIPQKYRTILVLRYKEDFSLHEIAEILGAPYNTVKAYHSRGLNQLKRAFVSKDVS